MMAKRKIATIRQRNTIIGNILSAMSKGDCFLIMGHKNPDEDCIASMIALSLLLNKFSKTAFLMIPRKINKNYQYLINICRYNAIEVLHNDEKLPEEISTIFFLDTPKPSMRETFPGSEELFEDSQILKIEIDHHLEADSDYCGDPSYALVDEASSASELVGMLAFKLESSGKYLEPHNIEDLFSRNFVLAVLTGIIGDSKMGKFLKTGKERWFYRRFSAMFSDMLESKTHKDSQNFSSMKEIFSELQKLSIQEDHCLEVMLKGKLHLSPDVGSVIVSAEKMKQLKKDFDHDTIVSVARYAADILAEESGKLSLVVYVDDDVTGLVQFRVRRSHSYRELDLRTILSRFNIENGGGHPGAIGFRILREMIPDLGAYVRTLVAGMEELVRAGEL
jgi:nanoRNase/pAp phosphatase (c-di-AMP/oligoRNAs hydrolase)